MARRAGVSDPAQDGGTSRTARKKLAPEHGADLRDLARGAEPVEPRGERLLQGRRDRLRAALDAALQAGGA